MRRESYTPREEENEIELEVRKALHQKYKDGIEDKRWSYSEVGMHDELFAEKHGYIPGAVKRIRKDFTDKNGGFAWVIINKRPKKVKVKQTEPKPVQDLPPVVPLLMPPDGHAALLAFEARLLKVEIWRKKQITTTISMNVGSRLKQMEDKWDQLSQLERLLQDQVRANTELHGRINALEDFLKK
jgi:hypothetical protein